MNDKGTRISWADKKREGKRKSAYLSMTVPSINTTDVSKLDCSYKRVVFLDLNGFYECWRILASDVLFDAMLILPNVYTEWILRPTKFINIPRKIDAILSEPVFLKMLQWKLEQGLVFCLLNTAQTVASWDLAVTNEDKIEQIAPFWRYLSRQLCQLPDPLTFKTANYAPLCFDPALFTSDSDVQPAVLLRALQTMKFASTASTVTILRAMLNQSNPSLFVVESYDEITGQQDTPLSEEVLDELSADVAEQLFFDEVVAQNQMNMNVNVNVNNVPLTPFGDFFTPRTQTGQTPYDPMTPFITREQEKKFDDELDDILEGVGEEWDDENSHQTHLEQMDLASTNNLGGLYQQHSMTDSTTTPILMDCGDDDNKDEEEQKIANVVAATTSKKRDSVLVSHDWWVSDEYYTNFETPELSDVQETENEDDEDL